MVRLFVGELGQRARARARQTGIGERESQVAGVKAERTKRSKDHPPLEDRVVQPQSVNL